MWYFLFLLSLASLLIVISKIPYGVWDTGPIMAYAKNLKVFAYAHKDMTLLPTRKDWDLKNLHNFYFEDRRGKLCQDL